MHNGFHAEAFSPCSISITQCVHTHSWASFTASRLACRELAAQGARHGKLGGWVMSDPAGTARVTFSEASAFLRLSELHRNLLEVNLNGI